MCRRILVTLQRKMCWGGELSVYSPSHRHGFSMLNRLLMTSKHVWSPHSAQLLHKDKYASKRVELILLPRICSCLFTTQFFPLLFSYDSEGRLTNVTFPTGVVTNLHGDMDKAITVDIESSSREEDVSITSNLSSIDSFYTMVQGKHASTAFNGTVWNTAGTEVACGHPPPSPRFF